MCGILFTNKFINIYNLDNILKFLKKRGPDYNNRVVINNYTFIHTLLSMTGPPTIQPFKSDDENIICIFNGEIYNFKEFGNYQTDGECLIPLYEKYGSDFISRLDGEFAIILVDFAKNRLIYSTDIFGTRPLWVGYNNKEFGISTYKSCLDRIGLTNNYQLLANKTCILDLKNIKIIEEKRVHTFDLNQYKNNFDDWNKAFSESIKKRTKYAKCGIFIGMSGGYDSGTIACELNKQNIEFSAYSIANVEDKQVLEERAKIIKNVHIFELERHEFLKSNEYLKENCEEYVLNFDNGEVDKYNKLIKQQNYNNNDAESLLKIINFRKHGQLLTNDNGAIGCSYICSLAKQKNEKIYLSGSGADEIFSDYGFNGFKYFEHSTIGGYFPDNLNDIFPWKNFFGNAQRAYLMKEEYVAGTYGIEGRYPFLDKYVVQEFLWLSPQLKNKNYKAPLDNYLIINNFPYEKNQKTGFGCGFTGPNPNGINFNKLTETQKQNIRQKKVTDINNNLRVNFDELLIKPTNSYENYYIVKKSDIKHDQNYGYKAEININFPGLKYFNKSSFTLLEDNKPLRYVVTSHDLIRNEGKGKYCIWQSNTLYFSSSDTTDPRYNNREYSIIKLKHNLRKLKYANYNNFNGQKYYITVVIKNCTYNTPEYFKIRDIFNYYNFLPNILVCDNYEIFMDLPNIEFCKFDDKDKYVSRVIINNILNTTIDDIRTFLFNQINYDDNYTIYKGNAPKVTISIPTIGNEQFKYALESALQQNTDCIINIIKNLPPNDALNSMINRCTTNYTIQMDEDMIFIDNNSVEKMYNTILTQDLNVWQYCFTLIDYNFGVTSDYLLCGIKIFNIKLTKQHNMSYTNNNMFAIDREIKHLINSLKLIIKSDENPIGFHQKNYSNMDIFCRSAKIAHEIYNPISNLSNNNLFYETGIFIRYITMFDFNMLLLNIIYIITFLEKDIDLFFNKMKCIKFNNNFDLHDENCKKNMIDQHVNMDNLDNLNRLKNVNTVNLSIDKNFIPIKDVKYYCLVGFIYPLYYTYEYDFNAYPFELINKI